ncbi:MAG: pyridoxamine 5'-phosphate oxidase family protein, partial [Candidatus Methanomethylophilaceae archaeon]|nr:pyridoxamine 5'-phosphate oxidase family protein [Candidatus Methanomethylophilaceae archaeon]
ELLKPMFDNMAGKDLSYEEGVEIFKGLGLDEPEGYKAVMDAMVDIIGLVDGNLKDDIVFLCLLVCAIDGEVTEKEKDWIQQLFDPMVTLSPMEYIEDFLVRAGRFVLATTCHDQPKMRVLGLKIILDDKIFFAVGTHKDVYKQLKANPKCELLAYADEEFIRWDGIAVFSTDPRLDAVVRNLMPDLVKMYDQMGWELGYFSIENGSAEHVDINNQKTVIF